MKLIGESTSQCPNPAVDAKPPQPGKTPDAIYHAYPTLSVGAACMDFRPGTAPGSPYPLGVSWRSMGPR